MKKILFNLCDNKFYDRIANRLVYKENMKQRFFVEDIDNIQLKIMFYFFGIIKYNS